jgi:excinuclease ABC subunit C
MEVKAHSIELNSQLEQLPTKPGVYQFFNREGDILYIGKAINLKARVGSYFKTDLLDRPWVRQMIPLIADIKVIEAENEVEALILESNLIKKHKPKYNSANKDDKRYAWIAVEQRVPFPRVRKVRDPDTQARYFGPYPDGLAVNHVLKFIRTVYPFRDCNLPMYPDRSPSQVTKSRLCVYKHLDLCPGPCDNLISSQEYRKNIEGIAKTLQGKKRSHLKELEKKMLSLAKEERYEEAARLRDKMQDLSYLSQRIDIHYGDAEDEFRQVQTKRFEAGIKEVAALLHLPIPQENIRKTRIECYDISNLANEITYGSMVVSEGSTINSSLYRVFKFAEYAKHDDPEMLKRVLTRRLKHLTPDPSVAQHPDESLTTPPTIVLLDGAQSQLSAARAVVPSHIGLLAISKGKHLKRKGKQQVDEFWILAADGKPRRIKLENPFLFQHLRDEAHRFAIKHLRQGKRFLQKKSILDEIPGIGPRRRKLLVKTFGSVETLQKKTLKEIEAVLRHTPSAKAVYSYLKDHAKRK